MQKKESSQMDEFGVSAQRMFLDAREIGVIIAWTMASGLAVFLLIASISGVLSLVLSERRNPRKALDKEDGRE